MTLKKWEEISDTFQDTLVLGNGASIAVDDRFAYKSLLDEGRKADLIGQDIGEVFNYVGTDDFELVLWTLGFVNNINEKLGIETRAAKDAYRKIQAALIQIIQRVHPQRRAVEEYLEPIRRFMKDFKTIVSLNYDLIVYWSMLEGNNELGNHFKDCFVNQNQRFDKNWQRLREPIRGAASSTLVFYPHGNLCLLTDPKRAVRDPEEGDFKVACGSNSPTLLDAIVDEWREDSKIPLFVSEGDSKQKLVTIRQSDYLSTVFNSVIPSLNGSVAIYGWSLDSNDEHILKQLCKQANKIAVSVHRDSHGDDIGRHCESLKGKIRAFNNNVEVVFYDAESPGCWIHSTQPSTARSSTIF